MYVWVTRLSKWLNITSPHHLWDAFRENQKFKHFGELRLARILRAHPQCTQCSAGELLYVWKQDRQTCASLVYSQRVLPRGKEEHVFNPDRVSSMIWVPLNTPTLCLEDRSSSEVAQLSLQRSGLCSPDSFRIWIFLTLQLISAKLTD